MLATLLTTFVLAQAPKIEIKEDPIDHEKTTTLDLGKIASMTDGTLELLIHYDGDDKPRGPIPPSTKLGIHIVGVSKRWNFLNYRKVVLADGGKSIDLGEPSHRGSIKDYGVLEQVYVHLTFGDLDRLAAEPNLKGKVGSQVFELTDEQQKWLRKYVERLKMNEDEARKLEVAEKQQEQAKKDEAQQRIAGLRQEWFEMRNAAIARAKQGSKSQYEKNFKRNVDKAADEFCSKHGMNLVELKELAAGK